MRQREDIIINSNADKLNFKEVLLEIKENIEGDVKFKGWLKGYKIVSIDDRQYKVLPGDLNITLKETRSTQVAIPNITKQKSYDLYNEILKTGTIKKETKKEGDKMKNKIKEILEQKDISIKQLSTVFNDNYNITHKTVNREDLSNTQLVTLVKIAKFLEVDITDLYEHNKN